MSSGEVQVGRDAVRRLQKLGVDVSQLVDVPIPDELWSVIERVVRGVKGRDQRWYAAAAMYGRFVAELKAGRSANDLTGQYAAGKSLAPILQHPEMRELVLAENLSGPLNKWLADVIRRTRLRPGEKLDVAAIQVEKIHDGLSAGDSVTEITAWLGKPRQVARRMRRTMLKRRSWLSRVFRRFCQLAATLALLLAVTIGWLLYRYYGVAAVESEDIVNRLDQRAAAIPLADRAWPLYAAGLEHFELPTLATPEAQKSWPQMIAACEAGPDHAAWTEAVEFLDKHRDAVDRFLEAAEKPRLGYIRRDSVNDRWMSNLKAGTVSQNFSRDRKRYSIALPEYQALYYVKLLLVGNAHQALAEGDHRRAMSCLSAVAKMARQVWIDEDEFPASRISALNYFHGVTATMSKCVAQQGASFGDEDLQQCLSALQSWDRNWRGELLASSRNLARSYLSEMYSSDGRFTRQGIETVFSQSYLKADELSWLTQIVQTKGIPTQSKEWTLYLLGPCLVPFVADRDEMLAEFDTLSNLYETEQNLPPTAQQEKGSGAYARKLQGWLESKPTQVRYLPLLGDLHSAMLSSLIEGAWKKTAENDGVMIAVACHLYRLRHGAWPESVAALIPEILEAAPLDPIDGKPLRLVYVKERPFVYSVGFDGKDATARIAAGKLKGVDFGDWQLFPPLEAGDGAEPAR